MSTETFEIMSPKQALKTIKLIATAGKKLDERIHAVGVAGLAQYAEHGNTDVLSSLVKAMPKSARGNALKYWITQHANVQWKAKGGPNKDGIFIKNPKDEQREVSLDHAIEFPFYVKEDKEPAVFNPETRVASLVTAFKKAMEKGAVTAEQVKEAKAKLDSELEALVA